MLTESKCDLKKSKAVIVMMIVLAASFASMLLSPSAHAANVAITSVSPANRRGRVGDEVRVVGTINKTGGQYQVWLRSNYSSIVVSAANAVGTSVNATFKVPHLVRYNYTLVLQDVAENINATSWLYVNTTYYVQPRNLAGEVLKLPTQVQQTGSAGIWVNVTGGEANKAYAANVTVKLPSPANTTYWTLVKFNTTSTGEGSNITTVYPSSFQGSPHTNLTGTYSIAFNKTYAISTFNVGLTNSTEYHRGSNVDIKAAAYRGNEGVAVKISFGTTIPYKENRTADLGGIVNASWPVPLDASLGTYTINVTSISSNATVKNPRDVQNFTVPGFGINVTTKNLALEPVLNVTIRVFESRKFAANGTSDSKGLVSLKLETGNYTCNATFRGKKVGERPLNVTGPDTFNLICNLTNLRVLVTSQTNVPIPDVRVFLRPDNLTLTTFVNGTATAHSLLPVPIVAGQSYVLNASRYDVSFNVTPIQTLLVNSNAVAWFNVSIICPTLSLQVVAVRANGTKIPNVIVKVQELIGGLHGEATTDPSGKATFSFIFGRYVVAVYDRPGGTRLNETTVDLFQNQNVSISCLLYGLTVSIKVVDFLGQPISNVNIVLQREGTNTLTGQTPSDGMVTFRDVMGGAFQMTVFTSDQTQPWVERSLLVNKPDMVETVHIEKYVVLVGMLVETSQFVTVMIIVLALAAVLAVEVYRRRHLKPQKNESLSDNK
jgi:hypothetical protein